MNSIPQSIQSMGAHAKKTFYFFQRYRVGQILRTANACKIKGFQAVLVFLVLVESVFESRSRYMQRKLHPETLPFAKDVTYRFLNSCHTNWRRFVLLLAARIIRDTIEPLTDSQRRNAIVIDDTLYERSRSRSVELLAYVHDHVKNRNTSGFRLLVAGWTDGNTFLPIDFCLLSTENPKMRINDNGRFVYEGLNQTTKRWESIETYGGKMTENIVQAIARDCLIDTMLRLESKGFKIVFHIHDETVIEATLDQSLNDIKNVFCEPISWAPGLPLKGEGYVTPYYLKD